MNKKSTLLCGCLVVLAVMFFEFLIGSGQDQEAKNYLEVIYDGVNGFGIPTQEADAIKDAGGKSTYGEIKPESLKKIFDDLDIKKTDVFCDLGSGIGKTGIQAHVEYPFEKVKCIELSPTRHEKALQAKARLKKQGKLDSKRTLDFVQGDIAHARIDDATIVYMCSTCYPEGLMQVLLKKLSLLKDGLRVITLKPFPNDYRDYGFTVDKKYNLPMTWTKGADVHVYTLNKKNKKK